MTTIADECSKILNCSIKSLREHMNHPENRLKIQNFLSGRKARTTYQDKNGFQKTITINGLTKHGADSIQAYGKLPRPFNISVAAHYYARHRIRLHYPYLPCIVEKFTKGEDRFYPMELLELIKEDDLW
jgi:hypothetical protein